MTLKIITSYPRGHSGTIGMIGRRPVGTILSIEGYRYTIIEVQQEVHYGGNEGQVIHLDRPLLEPIGSDSKVKTILEAMDTATEPEFKCMDCKDSGQILGLFEIYECDCQKKSLPSPIAETASQTALLAKEVTDFLNSGTATPGGYPGGHDYHQSFPVADYLIKGPSFYNMKERMAQWVDDCVCGHPYGVQVRVTYDFSALTYYVRINVGLIRP